jgi:hypothetical protein
VPQALTKIRVRAAPDRWWAGHDGPPTCSMGPEGLGAGRVGEVYRGRSSGGLPLAPDIGARLSSDDGAGVPLSVSKISPRTGSIPGDGPRLGRTTGLDENEGIFES